MHPQHESPESLQTVSHEQPHHRKRAGTTRRLAILFVVGLIVGGIGLGVAVLQGILPNPLAFSVAKAAEAPSTTTVLPTAKVVRPRKAAAVPITVEQLALVEPYYRADLRARASGIVRKVHRDIGDKVKVGDLLLEIDVPESEQEVARASAMILQREQELKVSEAKLKDANAARDVSAATIKQRLADVEGATATRDLKKRKWERFKELAERGSVVGTVVDEEERDYLASEATVTASKANVERARADFAESGSKVEAAAADIELKKAQIVVAQKELDRARAVSDYARVTAPFDGVVVRRNVDPGSFVQNATTGASEALISIARVDLMTVIARFPDTVAPFVHDKTRAIVQIDDIPGLSISTAVTRFAPSVQNADRTMRVEVDLFNGSQAEYAALLAALKAGGPNRPTKGANDPAPVRAFAPEAPSDRRLLPGMSGSLKLILGGFGESYVLPSTAVYSRSGMSYILLVENDRTRQVPVRIQLNDGNTVRIALLSKKQDATGNTREILTDLTGQEHVVVARQMELGDGNGVKPSVSDW